MIETIEADQMENPQTETKAPARLRRLWKSDRTTELPPQSIILHCMICLQPLSETRSRRATSTCSEKCKDRLDALRAEQRCSRKCPHCLHPSTPEEREE